MTARRSTGAVGQEAVRARPAGSAASRIETVLTLLVIALLLPVFLALGARDDGRDARYADLPLRPQALPEPLLPALCARHGALADAALRDTLCRRQRIGAEDPPGAMPPALAQAARQTRQAFLAPLQAAQSRAQALRQQQQEGVGDLLALSDEIELLLSDAQPYAQRHALDAALELGPLPLHCAYRAVEGALAAAPRAAAAGPDPGRANALLLLGAAFDGVRATERLAATALLPAARPSPGCTESPATSFGEAAALMADARQAQANAVKNEGMRELLRSAGWQWAAWMLLGLGFVKLSRRLASPMAGVALALAAWTVAAWAGRVPWPLAGDRSYHPARAIEWLSAPAGFVWVLLGAALLLLVLALRLPRPAATPPQTMASRFGFPGLALATGVGWALLLDLSSHAHLGNRYLALYHQGHLWLGLLVVCVLLCLRQTLARAMAWTLSLVDELAGRTVRRFEGPRGRALLVGGGLAVVLLASWALSNLRQLTSELGRLWLILGGAWFFFLRGGPLAERLAGAPGAAGSLWRYIWPLLAVAAVLGVAMVSTRDFGPLLIAAYGAGAFLAASVAMWWHQRSGARRGPAAFAIALFCAWIGLLTWSLLHLGSVEDTTAGRLESLAAPLASGNDQLALARWFQQAAPALGFGFGQVPWCGHMPGIGCAGVPAQVHSDYTLTALVGVLGPWLAGAFVLAVALWLHRLVRHHGRVTRGEPRLVRSAAGLGNDDQAFLSWMCVAWVVLALCQLAVTVAGNLAVLPLTGVTFPFVSYGLTSLLVNMAFLGLCLNVNVPAGASHE